MSPLPLCRIPTRVQNGEYEDDISLHREVHVIYGVGFGNRNFESMRPLDRGFLRA